MGTIDIITKEIEAAMEELSDGAFFDCCYLTNDNGETLSNKIEAVLKSYTVRDYSIDVDWLFSSLGLEIGYLSVAWVDNSTKKLQHISCGLCCVCK